ncbi:TonB-dependent receptor [Sulfurimonas sp. HSL-1656]|uniref:TonB-dependent receptor n=1 Tax=Thiomicrolovo subterrani TaxID=3131934 RepID=UPI0031F8693B
MDRKFLIVGFAYAIVGLGLGIFMAASKDHVQFTTHAHIMLIGFLLSFLYALCHKLWLNGPIGILAKVQYYMHLIGASVISGGLFLLYGNFVPLETIDPVLAMSSVAVFVAAVLMFVLLLKTTGERVGAMQ